MNVRASLRRLRDVLAERRAFRALPSEMSFDDAFEVARTRIGIGQHPEEIEWLFGLVRRLAPAVVVEIGVSEGGTLFLWTRAAAANAHLIGVDAGSPGRFGRFSSFPLVRRAFATAQQRLELVMPVDSHAPATAKRVRKLLRGRDIDFLFIDGDHSYEGVLQDARMYGPLVRAGGLVAFHDVSSDATTWTEGTARFWREFAGTRPVESRVAADEPGYGIGAYYVRPDEGWRLSSEPPD